MRSQDEQLIEDFLNYNPIAKLLREAQTWHYNIGDVLIRYTVNDNGRLIPQFISSLILIPIKYRIIYIDELGVPWVKRISVSKGLGKALRNLAEMSYNSTFRIDPRQTNAQILETPYDPRDEYREYYSQP